MRPLYKELEKNKVVNIVKSSTYNEIIKEIYNSNEFKFYLNSELIDVKDNFRIFKFHNHVYVSKKTLKEKGIIEYENAKKAYAKLNNIKIKDYTIKIVVPKPIEEGEYVYLISNYKGKTLQECLYNNKLTNKLDLEILIDILKKFINLGIMHKGFSPRNIIIKNNIIYILDWEDVIFYNNPNLCNMNLLWQTNVILDWNYFYDIDEIIKKLKFLKTESEENIQLIKYEENFKNIIDWQGSDLELRKRIMGIVLFSEKKLDKKLDEFYLIPNDLAGLISNLYNFEIDVLADMIFYLLRKKNEELYINFLRLISRLVVYLYRNNISMQTSIIKLFLIMLEEATSNKQYFLDMELPKKYDDLIILINNYDSLLLKSYYSKNITRLAMHLEKSINSLLKEINSQYTKSNLNFEKLAYYILHL